MQDKTLIAKYQSYLHRILSSLDFPQDEEGAFDLRIVTRIAKTTTTTIRKSNAYLQDKAISDEDSKYWSGMKLIAFEIIAKLTDIIPSILAESALNGNVWQLLYAFEVVADVLQLLHTEKILKEGDSDASSIGTLTAADIQRIADAVQCDNITL